MNCDCDMCVHTLTNTTSTCAYRYSYKITLYRSLVVYLNLRSHSHSISLWLLTQTHACTHTHTETETERQHETRSVSQSEQITKSNNYDRMLVSFPRFVFAVKISVKNLTTRTFHVCDQCSNYIYLLYVQSNAYKNFMTNMTCCRASIRMTKSNIY